MANDAAVTLVGNVTKEPDLRYTAGGKAVTSFGMAVNRRYMVNNEWTEEVSFFNVTCWADLAENVAASLNKGNRAIVTGRLSQRTYETREGEKRNIVEVVADSIGPDLRWATCEVTRTERTSAPQQAKKANPSYAEEEPF
jgi:single-strand DNA-binding protein|tara:strand:+ start:505 stop:924 length:420 start_codon:yes stop_codon:yes gene_type:complete